MRKPFVMKPNDMNQSDDSQSNRSPNRSRLRSWLSGLTGKPASAKSRRGRLLLESLESRQLMAGDVDLFATGTPDAVENTLPIQTDDLGPAREAQGELVNDLVQFAQDLTDSGTVFFGAEWCPACTTQKELFQDGGKDLPFVEVTNPDRSPGQIAIDEGITQYPTWEFPDGSRETGVLSLAELSQRSGVPIPQSEDPTFAPLGNQTVGIGSPLHIPIDVYDPDGGAQTVTVTADNPALLEAVVLTGNRSIRIDMETYGDMVFELFEQRAPRASGRVADLADAGFYDGIIFHRVTPTFVIQAGDPTGTGTSGSTLGNFDDDFHPDLQHNQSGVLSFAKTSDDTNNSQFFVVETASQARHLDFNHSIFGQLVEGEDVREAISSHATNNSSVPTMPITIESIDTFVDNENAVVMLKAASNATGTTSVTVTVTDPDGNTHSETMQVTVTQDNRNGQPFLNDIAVPTEFAAGSPATLQLTSIDVEGDAVTYLANLQSNAANASVDVDENTGAVTVTPAAGFTGEVDVLVGVRPGPGVQGNSGSDFDSQLVTFNFTSDSLATPTGLDLLAGTDSGTSNSDNVTNVGTLTFQVDGVTDGAQVEIINVDTGVNIGLALASGNSVIISTNNIAALGDGTYSLAARQTLSGVTSDLSSPITVVFDSNAPASVVGSAVTSGNVGRAYSSDLISNEEGSGVVYELTAAPTGATIDSATGVIDWTPSASQIGANTFTVALTDVAGNTLSESFDVQVADEALVEIDLELLDTNGNVITSLDVGQRFTLNINTTDARGVLTRAGVFATYLDVLFDNTLVRPVAGTSITFGTDLPRFTTGNITNGLIDEVGGTSSAIEATRIQTSLVASVQMEAFAAGTAAFRTETGEASGSEILLFGINGEIPTDAIAFGSVNIPVGAAFTAVNDTFAFTEGDPARVLDVLANDVASGNDTLSVVSVTQPAEGGTVTLTNGEVTFLPEANFDGQSTFTYRVSDSAGIQQTATVTVNFTGVNDAPVAVNDTFVVSQDSTSNSLAVLTNDTTDAGETLQVTAVNSISNGGTVTIAANGQTVNYTPAAGFVGNETFTYEVSDGSLTSTATVSVTVESADAAPTVVNDSFTLSEDAVQASYNVLDNDTADADGEAFLIDSLGTPSQGGTVAISSDAREILYTPAANFFGVETVTYTVRDTGGGVATATATFTVAGVNDAPPIANPTVNVNRASGETSVLAISDLPSNVDGASETLTFTQLGTPSAGGSVQIDATSGDILYTPPSGTFVGTDTFTYSVNDGSLTSNGTISVVVNDFIARNIVVQSNGFAISGIRLVGNDLVGDQLDSAAVVAADADAAQTINHSFDQVLPGSYTVQIPAVPFLANGAVAQEIAVTSGPADGDATVDTNLGRLRPEFLSIRDWLGSASSESVLVAVAPGGSSVLSSATSSTTTIQDPVATMDSTSNTVTLLGTDDTGQAIEATINTANNANFQTRGQVDDLRLFKINVASDTVTFNNSASASATTGSAQGELIESPSLPIGDGAAQGEQIAAAASTVADVFVPATSSDETVVLATDEGDLWNVQNNRVASPSPTSIATSNRVDRVDEAMSSVSSRLELLSSAADEVAQGNDVETTLRNDAVDQALR